MIIKEDYVSFEVAKLLKDKGFEEVCNACYEDYGKTQRLYMCDKRGAYNIGFKQREDLENRFNLSKERYKCAAPTLQMAMKWLREIHKIYIDINIRIILEQWAGYNINIYKTNTNNCLLDKVISLEGLKDNTSYEQACEVTLKYCLKNLI